jgi:hypothetical protein
MIRSMSDQPMRDNHDPMLSRLFAERAGALPSDTFLTQLELRLTSKRQKQRLRLILAAIVMLVSAGLVMPWILQTVSAVAALATEFSATVGPLFQPPLTWLVWGALAFGVLPVVYVWRA